MSMTAQQKKSKTTLKQKFLLIFLGVFLSLVLIEGLLHLGGAIFVSIQNYQNQINIKNEHEFRILCIGESLTALGGEHSYPSQLENILNAANTEKTFKVINKGLPATESEFHAFHLEQNIKRYKPHMIVSMLGINDEVYAPLINGDKPHEDPFWQQLRIYTLAKLLSEHLKNQTEEMRIRRIMARFKAKEDKIDLLPSSARYLQLGFRYRAFDQLENSIANFKKAVELDPRNYQAWGYLGLDYKQTLDFEKSAKAFEQMIKVVPEPLKESKMVAYNHLASAYMRLREYEKARETFRELLRFYPAHPSAYGEIGETYMQEKDYKKAQETFVAQITLHPHTLKFYKELADCYTQMNEQKKAIKLFQEGVKVNPTQVTLFVDFANYHILLGNYREAEEILLQALKILPESMQEYRHTIIGSLVTAYREQGKHAAADALRNEYLAKAKDFKAKLQNNYQLIKRTCLKRGIKLVAVQYPMRDIKILKEILQPPGNITFVDNKDTFENAVTKEGYRAYFTDHFAGDFGHCTPKGYHMLANNVAGSILEILERKNGLAFN